MASALPKASAEENRILLKHKESIVQCLKCHLWAQEGVLSHTPAQPSAAEEAAKEAAKAVPWRRQLRASADMLKCVLATIEKNEFDLFVLLLKYPHGAENFASNLESMDVAMDVAKEENKEFGEYYYPARSTSGV